MKRKNKNEFMDCSLGCEQALPGVPFYHDYAKKLSENIDLFKNVIKKEYGVQFSKPLIALVVPDDTSEMEKSFLQGFFLNGGRGVALTTISQTLSKTDSRYISLSRTVRSVALQYINEGEVMAERFYDRTGYDVEQIKADIGRIHIDTEYNDIPVLINNFSDDMLDFFSLGQVLSQDKVMKKIAEIKLEKV
ncbi:MAG: hypothetical protein LIO46_00810 [Clostridiales bacterium]|nr:hypothetical protein [Clostridiales bacterium]